MRGGLGGVGVGDREIWGFGDMGYGDMLGYGDVGNGGWTMSGMERWDNMWNGVGDMRLGGIW